MGRNQTHIQLSLQVMLLPRLEPDKQCFLPRLSLNVCAGQVQRHHQHHRCCQVGNFGELYICILIFYNTILINLFVKRSYEKKFLVAVQEKVAPFQHHGPQVFDCNHVVVYFAAVQLLGFLRKDKCM